MGWALSMPIHLPLSLSLSFHHFGTFSQVFDFSISSSTAPLCASSDTQSTCLVSTVCVDGNLNEASDFSR